jgi:hypothetical protein
MDVKLVSNLKNEYHCYTLQLQMNYVIPLFIYIKISVCLFVCLFGCDHNVTLPSLPQPTPKPIIHHFEKKYHLMKIG